MTFTAVLCVGLVYVAIKWLNELWPQGIPSKIKIPLAIIAGVGAVFLVGQSDWAASQEFLGKTLDNINGWSKVIAGIALGAAAVGLDTTFKSVSNIGENKNP